MLYLEEGDLAYKHDQHIHGCEIFPKLLLPQPIADIISQLGFKCNEIRWGSFKPTWFSDAFGKYRGVIASNNSAFEGFSGSRMIINIPSLDIVPAETAIILIASFIGPEKIISKLLANHSVEADAFMIQSALSRAFLKHFGVAAQRLRTDGLKIVVKAHPSADRVLIQKFLDTDGRGCVLWEETELEYQTRKAELGHVNFSKFCIIGNSSCIRYVLERRQDRHNILLTTDDEIAITGLSFLLEEMRKQMEGLVREN